MHRFTPQSFAPPRIIYHTLIDRIQTPAPAPALHKITFYILRKQRSRTFLSALAVCRVAFSHFVRNTKSTHNSPSAIAIIIYQHSSMCETFITKRIDTHTLSQRNTRIAFLLELPKRARVRAQIEKRTSVPICQARGKLSLVAPAGETLVRSLFARLARVNAGRRAHAYNDNYQSIRFNSQAI